MSTGMLTKPTLCAKILVALSLLYIKDEKMKISLLIFNVAILFIMMVPGFIMKKCRLCSDGFGKGISNLVLYIAQPALIVYAYISCTKSFSEIWLNAIAVLVLSIVFHVIFTVVTMLLFGKAEDSKRRMLRFATIFSNAAFMGIPLVQAILGAEAAIYASVYNITYNLFLWTLGVYLCTRESGKDMDGDGDCDLADEYAALVHHSKKEVSLLKVLLHPVTLASVIGLILLATGVNASVLEGAGLSIITESLFMLKELVAPLAMVVVGLRLADVDFRGMYKDLHMYLFLALRHIALPLVCLGFIRLIELMGVSINEEVTLVLMLMASAPAATSAAMFAEKYNCDAVYVSRLIVVSTILCIATMPAIFFLVNL